MGGKGTGRRFTEDLGLRLSPSAGLGQVDKGFASRELSLLPLGTWKVKSLKSTFSVEDQVPKNAHTL